MTARLGLRLLGTPQVHLDDEAITGFRTAKAEALLYYLAVTGQGHSRETLADLLKKKAAGQVELFEDHVSRNV